MSTSYGIIGYPDVPRDDAAAVLAQCEAVLREGGWIIGADDPEAVFAPKGPCFRPGPASGIETKGHTLPDGKVLYDINGVVFCGPKYMNYFPFSILPSFACPACGVRTNAQADEAQAQAQMDRCVELFERYFADGADASRDVTCIACEAQVDVNALVDDGVPTFIFSDVAVEFWHWPPEVIDKVAAVLDAALGRTHLQGWVKV